jgi:glycosyltransferase involved in cell wall biosynthesis
VTSDLAQGAGQGARADMPAWQNLRVAVNATSLWRPLAGIGQYTWNIAQQWAKEGRPQAQYFYGNDWSPVAAPRLSPGLGPLKRMVKRIVPRPYEITRALLQRRFDRRPPGCEVYLEPSFLPFRFDGPVVLTVHDLSHVRYAATHPSDRVRILAKLLPLAIERAAHILTVSNFQRDEIIEVFGVAPQRVTACHLGVSAEFRPRAQDACDPVLARHGLRYRGFLLTVGTLEPRKNLSLTLRAYADLPAPIRDHCPLVVVGMRGWNTASVAPRLRALVQSGAVRALGFVDEAELPSIYSAARIFLYPSLYEGFGLPALEAMASGVPVIVSNRSSLPEVVGGAGIQIDPEDAAALCLAIQRLHDDPAAWQQHALAGLARAREFTWSRCAAVTAAVLARAAGRA